MIRKRAFTFIASLFFIFAVGVLYALIQDQGSETAYLNFDDENQIVLVDEKQRNNVAYESNSGISNSMTVDLSSVFKHSIIFNTASSQNNSEDINGSQNVLYGSTPPTSTAFFGAIIPIIGSEKGNGIFKENGFATKPGWKAGLSPVSEMTLSAPGPPGTNVIVPLDFGTVYILLAGTILGLVKSFAKRKIIPAIG